MTILKSGEAQGEITIIDNGGGGGGGGSSQAPMTEKRRKRLIMQQQWEAYRMALLQRNMTLISSEGDGNCLFRSVSDQIYGTEEHHLLVRAKCMDYMSAERDHFQVRKSVPLRARPPLA
jgi:hypothetical protein